MYTFESRVRYSELDHRQRISLPAVINYLQDCTTFHSESIGQGIEELKKVGKAWVLSYWQIVVERYPKIGEKIAVSTWATGFTGILGTRNFQILDEEGRRIIYAYSLWTYMDMKKKRPVKISQDVAALYKEEPPLEMEYAPRKIRRSETMTEKEAIRVRKYQIDTNEHVNNCQYVQMALEALEREITVRQVRVEYKRSAVYRDQIIPRVAEESGRIVVELCDTEGNPYAIVEFIGE